MATPISSNFTRLTSADLLKFKRYLIENVGRLMEGEQLQLGDQAEFIKQRLQEAYVQTKVSLPEDLRKQIFHDILDELTGFGPIQPLLEDEDISEVMVNGPKKVFIEKKGKLTKSAITFDDDDHVLRVIDRIILPLGRRVDADTPTVDARLPDGSRVNAVIRPVSIDGPSITIRKFKKDKLSIQQLINFGSLTPQMAEFIRACVLAHLNIVISGGTGSGKTTLLNVLSSFIPEEERIITIEDAAELQLQQDHVLRMETKVANVDGKGAVTIRDLVRNSLRMRPDRIIVGECRGGEALDMLQAMNTGHDGSITTGHANTPRDMLRRLETMVLLSGVEIPARAIREQIASGIDVIVHTARTGSGGRAVTSIAEISGMNDAQILLQEIFRREKDGTGAAPEGKLAATGVP